MNILVIGTEINQVDNYVYHHQRKVVHENDASTFKDKYNFLSQRVSASPFTSPSFLPDRVALPQQKGKCLNMPLSDVPFFPFPSFLHERAVLLYFCRGTKKNQRESGNSHTVTIWKEREHKHTNRIFDGRNCLLVSLKYSSHPVPPLFPVDNIILTVSRGNGIPNNYYYTEQKTQDKRQDFISQN